MPPLTGYTGSNFANAYFQQPTSDSSFLQAIGSRGPENQLQGTVFEGGTPGAASSSGLFGLSNQQLSNIGTLGQLGTGLAGAYLGYRQLGLAEDAYNFNKRQAEREYQLARDAYDRNVARAESIGEQSRAGRVN